MEEVIKEDIKTVLKRIIEILEISEPKDTTEIMELSNHTIHNATIFQDEDSISIAILIYSISKMIRRKREKINYKPFLDLFNNALVSLENDSPDGYRKKIKQLFNLISEIDHKIKFYIEEVIKQAQIKKGSKLYEHGISLARASEVLGISQWDLMDYIGKTSIGEAFEKEVISVKDRILYTRNLFK